MTRSGQKWRTEIRRTSPYRKEKIRNYVAQGSFAVQTGEYLEEHFNTLESSFGQLNNLYDYRIRDTKTGEILSNLADTDIVAGEDQSFYLTFCI